MTRTFPVITLMALFSFVSPHSFSQTARLLTVPVEKMPAVDTNFIRLEQPNSVIRKDSVLNERIVDLVEPLEMDTILPNRTQHHRFGVGWFLYIFGFKWVAIDMHRQKLVGTAKGDVYAPGLDDDRFTEHDVNIDLLPHTPKYTDLMYTGYVAQKKRNQHFKREHRHPDFNKAPFVYPTDATLEQYRVHCELTPPKPYWKQINERFYPAIAGTSFSNHPNFGEPRPTLGFYGPLVMDCNHTCHTELHPYEWLYWLDVNPAKDSVLNTKRWLVGLQREYSNRFRRWSTRPRVGSIAVPFLFPANEGNPRINIEHLVYSEFMPKKFKQFAEVPAGAIDLNFTDLKVELVGLGKTISIHTNKPIDTEGMALWVSGVKTDGKWIWGYLHLAMSVREVYDARVTVTR